MLCSGRKIIQILEKNPKKDPSKYDEEDIQHMRKVAAYCKRHLAQEGKAKQDPDSKSAKSLKNWVSCRVLTPFGYEQAVDRQCTGTRPAEDLTV